MKKKTNHQEIMDKLNKIEIELEAQSYFTWYVLGIAMVISGLGLVFSVSFFGGLFFIILGTAIWSGSQILENKLRKKSK